MNRKQQTPQAWIRPEQPDTALERVRERVRTCIQCGTCTGSCPNAFAMDATPRKLWRLVLMGQSREIFESRTFALCSDCYCCTLRCPRGLALTDAMADLKQMAAAGKHGGDAACTAFYNAFLQSARRYGRVQETRLMARYLAVMTPRRPLMPFRFSGLGMQMIKKGKISLRRPSASRSLKGIFARIESMKDGQ